MIKIEQLCKTYDGGISYSVRNLDLELVKGELLVLLGSSGCGKSTTLKMINRLIEPSSGRILIDGIDNQKLDAVELRRSIGYVFQKIGLFPHLTVEENICLLPTLLKWTKKRMKARSDQLLNLVGLAPADYAQRLPHELSGGQQQRVGVARALVADPDYLLMDEPFGALDAVTRDSLQTEVIKLKKKLGKTIVFVTHDLFEAFYLGDRIAVLHEGVLQQCGTASELLTAPASAFVRELLMQPALQLERFSKLVQR